MTKVSIVIPAGGNGTRLGHKQKKQFLKHKGKTLLEWSLDPFFKLSQKIQNIVIALPKEDLNSTQELLHSSAPFPVHCVQGGDSRQASVFEGLKELKSLNDSGIWLVHDAARPLVHTDDLIRLIEKIDQTNEGALLASPVKDTIKLSDGAMVKKTMDREKLWKAQTPQGAPSDILWAANQHAVDKKLTVTDDASILEAYGTKVHLVEGPTLNFKVTDQNDWKIFTQLC